ncbi:MAG: hypothetical protein OXJ56_20165, partial [Rhodospirillaceae bacterium]|nr:hypothetical protein [Rhodospirillaceae bacterium]
RESAATTAAMHVICLMVVSLRSGRAGAGPVAKQSSAQRDSRVFPLKTVLHSAGGPAWAAR